jgi:amino acid transporter
MTSHGAWLVSLVFVVACWLSFFLTFLIKKKPGKDQERKRDRTSLIGIATQGVSFFVVWAVRRPLSTPIVPVGWESSGRLRLASSRATPS